MTATISPTSSTRWFFHIALEEARHLVACFFMGLRVLLGARLHQLRDGCAIVSSELFTIFAGAKQLDGAVRDECPAFLFINY